MRAVRLPGALLLRGACAPGATNAPPRADVAVMAVEDVIADSFRHAQNDPGHRAPGTHTGERTCPAPR